MWNPLPDLYTKIKLIPFVFVLKLYIFADRKLFDKFSPRSNTLKAFKKQN